jgi:hypothetical protein
MSQVIEHQAAFIVSSEPANGASNVSTLGSTFTVKLNTPITIPRAARNCTLEVNQADVWWTVPNISAALGNNVFSFSVLTNDYEFKVPDGLYSDSGLNALLSINLVQLGLNPVLFVLTGDGATQRTVFTFNEPGVTINFTGGDSTRKILGFDSRNVPIAPSTLGQAVFGDSIAKFNTINSFNLHSSLVNQGIPVNSNGASIIAKIPISVKPGSQIVYSPRNPVRTGANNLISKIVNTFTVWLTDQNDNLVDTNGEAFNATIILRWWAIP